MSSLDSDELTLLSELESDMSSSSYLAGPRKTNRGDLKVERDLEAVRSKSEATALSAAKQQKRSQVSSQRRRKKGERPIGESIKSALIDSKIERFVATVPRLLPPPLGRIAMRDFRTSNLSRNARDGPRSDFDPSTLRVLAWNVERGYRIAAVIASLRREMPDVVLLSEVDVGCDRSQMLDVGAEIASALGLCLVFATEKIKVNDESFLAQFTKRSAPPPRYPAAGSGVIVGAAAVKPSSTRHHQLDDEDEGFFDTLKSVINGGKDKAYGPRAPKGPRSLSGSSAMPVGGDIVDDEAIPDDDCDAFDGVEGVAILSRFDIIETEAIFLPDASRKNDPRKQRLALRARCRVPIADDKIVDFVAVHLDAFAGRSSRVEQFSPVLDRWRKNSTGGGGGGVPTVVGGDLNTHNQGLALLHPGMTGDDYFLHRLWRGQKLESWSLAEAEWWQRQVFDQTSLVDPFDKGSADKHNPNLKLGGLKLWSGKLDWLLYDKNFFVCVDHHASKADVASDHPYLRIDINLKSVAVVSGDIELDPIPRRHHPGGDNAPDIISVRHSGPSDDDVDSVDERRRRRRSTSLPPPATTTTMADEDNPFIVVGDSLRPLVTAPRTSPY